MKKLKSIKIGSAAAVVFLASILATGINFSAEAQTGYYKSKNCLFKPGSKCSGNGNDCGVSSDCSGEPDQ